MSDAALIRAARAYHDRGLAVVPIPRVGFEYTNRRGERKKATGKGPIIPGWQKRKLPWAELERELQADYIVAIGAVAGSLSGNLVDLDFDGEGWQGAFEHFLASWPDLESTPIVKTGSGKRQLWVRCSDLPADFTNQPFPRVDLNATIELRCNASNCVLPPSLHPSGERYEWIDEEAQPVEVPFEDLYKWLAEWAGVSPDRSRPEPIGELLVAGTRRKALFSIGGVLRRKGLTWTEILPTFEAINRDRCRPPLSQEQLEETAKGLMRYKPEDTLVVGPAPTEPEAPPWEAPPSETTTAPETYNPANRALDGGLDVLGDITWLWPHWIPNGFVSLIGGQKGTGKTTLAHWMSYTARGGPGSQWPDNQLGPQDQGEVLWIETEGAYQLWTERRAEWGKPKNAIGFLYPDPLQPIRLDNPETIDHVHAYCLHWKPRLIIVDSGPMAHRLDANEARSMGPFFEGLRDIAMAYALPVVIIMHMRKGQESNPVREMYPEDIHGSVRSLYEARSIILLDYPTMGLFRSLTPRVRVGSSNWKWRPELVMQRTDEGVLFTEYEAQTDKGKADILWDTLQTGPMTIEAVGELLGIGKTQSYDWLKRVGAKSLGKGLWGLAEQDVLDI